MSPRERTIGIACDGCGKRPRKMYARKRGTWCKGCLPKPVPAAPTSPTPLGGGADLDGVGCSIGGADLDGVGCSIGGCHE